MTLEFGRQHFKRARVRLYFCEFEATDAGQRVFDVDINGARVLKGFDIFKEAGESRKVLVKEVEHVNPRDALVIGLKPTAESKLRETILCAIELIEQD